MSIVLDPTIGITNVNGTAAAPALTGTDTNTGIFYPAADTIAFAEGGTESMRLDSNGNVGIGTTSPAYRLDTAGITRSEVQSGTTNNTAPTAFVVANRTTGAHAAGLGASIQFEYTNSGGGYSGGLISSVGGADPFTADLRFFPRNYGFTEAMRITSSGNVLIGMSGVSATGARMDVAQQTDSAVTVASFDARQATSGNQYGIFNRLNGDPNNTVNYFFRCNGGATERATIRSNGGIANFSANNVSLSDEREKTNIELAGSYLDKICAIPVKTFNYLDQNLEEDPGLSLGVIAQDVQKVAPELVSESNWGTEAEPKERLSIYQTDLQYALMKCIQEQQTIINDLKARIETLESK